MYMRLVNARFKPGALSKIREVYDKTIIPRLEKIDGCLCVCAIANERDSEDGISMTLWDTEEHARAYEDSGIYNELLAKVKPHLMQSVEWHVQLSQELNLEYQPVELEPAVETYTTTVQSHTELPAQEKPGFMYLRIVSVRLQSGKMEEFRAIYEKEIIPSLRQSKGCRFAFMTRSGEDENTILCVSLWETKQDADAYEKSGLFKKMREKTKHTFSEFYQWKMALEKEIRARMTTSEDMKQDIYRVVIGKSFR